MSGFRHTGINAYNPDTISCPVYVPNQWFRGYVIDANERTDNSEEGNNEDEKSNDVNDKDEDNDQDYNDWW